MELQKHSIEAAADLATRAGTIARELGSVAGLPVTLPMADAIKSAARLRLESLLSRTINVDITPDHTRAALNRINDGLPPNGPKNQQVKDSLLWEACVELTQTRRVALVTGDKGFFVDRKVDNGLAANLAAEPPVTLGLLRIHSSLEDFLSSIGATADITSRPDVSRLLEADARAFLSIEPTIVHSGIELRDADVRMKAFATENGDEVALSFSVRFETVRPQVSKRGSATINGESVLVMSTYGLRDTRYTTSTVHFGDDDGQDIRATILFDWEKGVTRIEPASS